MRKERSGKNIKIKSTQKRRYKLRRHFPIETEKIDNPVVDTYLKIRDEKSELFCHIRCECEELYSLSKKYHVVDETGEVWPTVKHEECGKVDWMLLVDWKMKTDILSSIEWCPYCRGNPCENNCEIEIADWKK